MKDTINYLISLNDFNWRGNAYQWFFYAGIVLTVIFEKRKMVRFVFGWTPLLYLACIFNPIALKLLNISGLSNQAYFTRLFSFMPLMYVIAYGFSIVLRLFRNTKSELIKLMGLTAVCCSIVLTGNNIYRESWLTRAENLEKVPRDTIEIVEAVKGDESIKIATIDANTVYIRQIADVITPYGRYMGNLGNQLSEDPPDVQRVMEIAGLQDMDYVCVHRTEATLNAFSEKGYQPYALTTNYGIFKVEGVPRVRRVLNEKRQSISVGKYDPSNVPESTIEGYYTENYDYNPNGRWIRRTFLDEYDAPFNVDDSFATECRDYYINGWLKSISYLDQFGNPALYHGCYKTVFSYNHSGQIVQESYYDESGQLMQNIVNQYAIKTIMYNSDGIIICEEYLNEDASPTLSSSGYAKIIYTYDGENLLCETYYDESGKEIGNVGKEIQNYCDGRNLFWSYTNGAVKEGKTVRFTTKKNGNHFNAVRFQLWDRKTGAYITMFGNIDHTGMVKGIYEHELPSGIYSLVFKGNANISDEQISCAVYLQEGDMLVYTYSVDEINEHEISVNDFYIGSNMQ